MKSRRLAKNLDARFTDSPIHRFKTSMDCLNPFATGLRICIWQSGRCSNVVHTCVCVCVCVCVASRIPITRFILATDIIKQHLGPLLVLRRLTPVRQRRRSARVLIEPAQCSAAHPATFFFYAECGRSSAHLKAGGGNHPAMMGKCCSIPTQIPWLLVNLVLCCLAAMISDARLPGSQLGPRIARFNRLGKLNVSARPCPIHAKSPIQTAPDSRNFPIT